MWIVTPGTVIDHKMTSLRLGMAVVTGNNGELAIRFVLRVTCNTASKFLMCLPFDRQGLSLFFVTGSTERLRDIRTFKKLNILRLMRLMAKQTIVLLHR